MFVTVNAKSSIIGKTPLAMAAYAGNVEIFEMLVNHGAVLDCEDNQGWNVMHEAIVGKPFEYPTFFAFLIQSTYFSGKSSDIVQYVMKIRPSMKYKANKDGRTPLHMAGFCNSDEDILNALVNPEDILDLPKRKGLPI